MKQHRPKFLALGKDSMHKFRTRNSQLVALAEDIGSFAR